MTLIIKLVPHKLMANYGWKKSTDPDDVANACEWTGVDAVLVSSHLLALMALQALYLTRFLSLLSTIVFYAIRQFDKIRYKMAQ